MNQQIKQLQQAKKLLNKARGEAEAAQSIIRKARGDLGLSKEASRAVDGLRRTALMIDQQCARIERKIDRAVIGVDEGSGDMSCVVLGAKLPDGVLRIDSVKFTYPGKQA